MHSSTALFLRVGSIAAAVLWFCGAGAAQVASTGGHWAEVSKRSGSHGNDDVREQVVWHEVVALHSTTPWLRLMFEDVRLERGSRVRITSLADGDVQTLNAEHLKQWQNSSAYFNGYAVVVELLAAPGTAQNSIAVAKAWAGDPIGTPSASTETICGGTDDREPSSDARVGRTLTAGLGSGCTGWIIDAPATGVERCHLTAGHCMDGNLTVMQFNVPASSANCALAHPSASNQYAIDSANWQFQNNGVGDDYGVFRCFPNPNTNLTTFQAQGAAFTLATAMPANGVNLRNIGFGVDGSSTSGASGANGSCTTCGNPSGARNQVQQTHTGVLQGKNGTALFHQVDTCGGNSGSPVILESSGQAIAIHTHGGCADPIGNSGNGSTQVTAAGVQAAIAIVCGGGGPGIENDECAGALEVEDGLNDPVLSVGASTSTPAWPCGTGANDLWYFYVATCTGNLTVETCTGSGFDTTVEAFSGGCGALQSLACNDDTCNLQSRITFAVVRGTTYHLRVGGFAGAMGTFQLSIACERTSATYAVEWKYSAKPDKLSGLVKQSQEATDSFTVRTNGTFSGGLIQDGTWTIDKNGKIQASVSQADLQRIADDLFGAGIVTIASVESLTAKLKEKFGKNGKPGKVQFSIKARCLMNGTLQLDIQLKLSGLESG